MKSILLLIALLFAADIASCQLTYGHGTTILTWATTDSIVIAADSRLLIGRNGDKWRDSTICKMGHRGNLFYAFAGYTIKFDERGKSTFDFIKVMDSCATAGKTLENTYAIFKKIALDFFRGAAEREDLPPMPQSGSYKLSYLTMVSTENDQLIHKDYDIRIIKQVDGSISIVISPIRYLANPYLARGGFADSVDDYLNRHPQSLLTNAPKALKEMIALEIKGHKDVGPPINALVIRRKNFRWLPGSRHCF